MTFWEGPNCRKEVDYFHATPWQMLKFLNRLEVAQSWFQSLWEGPLLRCPLDPPMDRLSEVFHSASGHKEHLLGLCVRDDWGRHTYKRIGVLGRRRYRNRSRS